MISKVASKVVASCGILENGTITRECITEKNLIGISKRKIKKKLLDRKKPRIFEKNKLIEAATIIVENTVTYLGAFLFHNDNI